MTERTVKLTEREVRALAHSTVADLIDGVDPDLFNRYPLVDRGSLSAVMDAVFELYQVTEESALFVAGGQDGWERLMHKVLTGEEK